MNFQTRYLWILIPSSLFTVLLFSISAIPMQDLPLHVFFASILSGGSPLLPSGEAVFSTSLAPKTYVGLFWFWNALSTFMPYEAGGRLIVCIYMVLSVVAFARLIRKVNPEMNYGIATAIAWWIPFSFFYYMGFLQYLFTIPFLLLLLADVIALREKPESSGIAARIFCMLIILFLLHPYGICFGLVCLVPLLPLLAGKKASGRTRQLTAVLLVIGFILFVIAVYSTKGPVKTGLLENLTQQAAVKQYTQSSPMKDAFLLALRVPVGPLNGVAKYIQFVALGCLVTTILLSLILKNTDFSVSRKKAYAICFLAAAILLFIVTVYISGKQTKGMLFHRLFIFPYFLLLISWSVIAHLKNKQLYVLVMISTVLHLSAVSIAHIQFHSEAKPARTVLDMIPENKAVLPLLFNRDSKIVRDDFVHVFQHITAYHPARNGGIYLLSRRAPPDIVVPQFDRSYYPQLEQPWSFKWNPVNRLVDYVFLRLPHEKVIRIPIMNSSFRRVVASLDERRKLVKQENQWAIWGPVETVKQ